MYFRAYYAHIRTFPGNLDSPTNPTFNDGLANITNGGSHCVLLTAVERTG
jgi:hypothetical protein